MPIRNQSLIVEALDAAGAPSLSPCSV